MKIGIYNEHLGTMGGGEKHMGAVVEYLITKSCAELDIITHKNVDLGKLAAKLKLNINKEKCKLKIIDVNSINAEILSANYDMFINTTYLSTLKPRAKKNIILVFFPKLVPFPFLTKRAFFRKILSLLDHAQQVHYKTGFYYREKVDKYLKRKFGNWTQRKFSFLVCTDKYPRKLKVVISVLDIGKIKMKNNVDKILCDNNIVNFQVKGNNLVFSFIAKKKDNVIIVQLKKTFMPANKDTRKLGIFVKSVVVGRNNISLRLKRAISWLTDQLGHYNYLDYYDLILTNSKYTKKWLKRLWGKDSQVLYPLVDVDEFASNEKKKKIIISVGRFFAGSHNKKHLSMIKMFKRLYRMGLLKNWEYHLCGGTHPEKIHQCYLKKVKQEALGYPIHIHSDISFSDLKKLYSKAAIFWHAAGFGESENKHPDKFEHFGITTVEAMAAGCIPVVIGKAGQLEIVKDGENGFLWRNEKELQRAMAYLLKLPSRKVNVIRKNAILDSQKFSREKFNDEMTRIISKLDK